MVFFILCGVLLFFCVGGVFISVPRILGYRPLASLIADNKFHVTLEKYPLVDLAA